MDIGGGNPLYGSLAFYRLLHDGAADVLHAVRIHPVFGRQVSVSVYHSLLNVEVSHLESVLGLVLTDLRCQIKPFLQEDYDLLVGLGYGLPFLFQISVVHSPLSIWSARTNAVTASTTEAALGAIQGS